jgi:hypothetical protein
MRNRILLGLLLISLAILLASSAQAGIRKAEPKEPVNHLVIGDCRDAPAYPDPNTIIITVSGHNVTVVHADAFYNCCFEFTTTVVQVGEVIDIYEHTSGIPCYCLCYFDVSTTIYGLDAGTYTISVYDADGEYVGGGTATVEDGKRPDALKR